MVKMFTGTYNLLEINFSVLVVFFLKKNFLLQQLK